MPSFSSLVGVSMTDPGTVAPYLGMIPPGLDSPRTYKPCTLLKPSKGSKDSRWLLIWWQFSPQDGKVIRRRQGLDLASYINLKDRERRAAEWMGAINSLLKTGYVYGVGEEVKALSTPQLSWQQLLEAFLVVHPLSLKRRDWYKRALGLVEEWAGPLNLTPTLVLPSHQSSHQQFLSQVVNRHTGEKWVASTRNSHWKMLSCLGKWASTQGYIKPEQVPFFQLGKREKEAHSRKHKPYTPAQLTQLLEAVGDRADLTLFFQLAYYTFLRPGRELTGLRVRDIEATTIRVIPEHDKNGVGRRVLIPRALEAVLTQQGIREYPPHYFVFGKGRRPGEEKVYFKYFYQELYRLLPKLGLAGQDYTLYSLKASGNIALWQATQNLELVRQQNGHSKVQMTMTYLRQIGVVLNQEPLLDFPRMGS